VAHAHTPFTVSLTGDAGSVTLAVEDGSASRPIRVDASLLDVAGRGVAIVETLSRSWGVTADAGVGKSVWAVFDAR